MLLAGDTGVGLELPDGPGPVREMWLTLSSMPWPAPFRLQEPPRQYAPTSIAGLAARTLGRHGHAEFTPHWRAR